MSRKLIAFAGFVLSMGGALGTGCQSATEAKLRLTTDIPCARLHSVAINVAPTVKEAEAQMGGSAAAASSTSCGAAGVDGIADLGSIVLYPGDGEPRNRPAAVVVRAGVGAKDPYDCLPPLYTGCVVAKRRFTYTPNQSLEFQVRMLLDCLDFPCAENPEAVENTTCVAKGVCADNNLKSFPPKLDAGSPDTSPLDGGPTDASPLDGGPSDASTLDAGSIEATTYDPNFRCPAGLPGNVVLCEDFNQAATSAKLEFHNDGFSTTSFQIDLIEHLGYLRVTLNVKNGNGYVIAKKLISGDKFFVAMDVQVPDMTALEEWQEIAFLEDFVLGERLSVSLGRLNGSMHLKFGFVNQNFSVLALPNGAGWHRFSMRRNGAALTLDVDGKEKDQLQGVFAGSGPYDFMAGIWAGNNKLAPSLAPFIGISYDNIVVTTGP